MIACFFCKVILFCSKDLIIFIELIIIFIKLLIIIFIKFPGAWKYTRDAINRIGRTLILAENVQGEYEVKRKTLRPVNINPYAKEISTQYSCQNLTEITKEYSTVGIQYSMSSEVLNVVDEILEKV